MKNLKNKKKLLLILFMPTIFLFYANNINDFNEIEQQATSTENKNENNKLTTEAYKDEVQDFFTPSFLNHLTAFGEAHVSNLLLMGFNRYVRQASYAYISWDTMHTNLTNPWVWDQDEFWVNHFGHPYQGSYYYAAARSNNLPLWESALNTMFASLIWELFAENETPSYNDLIVTTIGGISVGEMLYRLYFEVADFNKFLAIPISPMNAVNDAIWQGKLNRPDSHIYSLSTKIMGGIMNNNISFQGNFENQNEFLPFAGGLGINIIYGNPYGQNIKTPFDQFNLNVDFTVGKNYYNLSVLSDALLLSVAPLLQDNIKTTLGLSLHYDFLLSSIMNYGANSLGLTAKQDILLPYNWDLNWALHLNYIMMSASDYYYLFKDVIDPHTNRENREYDLGYGAGLKTSFSVSQPVFGTISLFGFFDWVKTINNSLPSGGSKGSSLIGLGSVSYEHPIYKKLSLGIDYSTYFKKAFYKDIDETLENKQFVNLYFKTKFF